MSDTSDDGWKRRFRGENRDAPLREEMEAFVDDHPSRTDLKSLRAETRGGADLATLVDESRDDRP